MDFRTDSNPHHHRIEREILPPCTTQGRDTRPWLDDGISNQDIVGHIRGSATLFDEGFPVTRM
jgi:hypothetical protein